LEKFLMYLRTFAAIAALLAPGLAQAQSLPRQAPLRVFVSPQGQTGDGVLVDRVEAGGTAARIGVEAGDRIVEINEVKVAAPADLLAQTNRLRDGAPTRVVVRRDDRTVTLSGTSVGRAKEAWPGAVADYGAVGFQGGLLRDIYVAPAAHAGAVVYLIPGYNCLSVEVTDPGQTYAGLIGNLLGRGIAVYRIEKPGMGDSAGTPDCFKSDFDTELAAFEAGYRTLTGPRGVDPDRIFILGHSMGGIQGPFVAAKAAIPPRGLAVYGTPVRNWHDYYMNIAGWQDFLMAGGDPVANAKTAERVRATANEVHHGTRTLAEMAADPKFSVGLRDMGWDGGELISGRSLEYWRDIAALDLTTAWRDSRTRVLSFHGESDLVAIDAEDQKLIAEIVNHYRPDSAVFVNVPKTDHLLKLVGDPKALREANRTAGDRGPASGPYNPQVDAILADWIERSMKTQPVRAVDPPQAAAG